MDSILGASAIKAMFGPVWIEFLERNFLAETCENGLLLNEVALGLKRGVEEIRAMFQGIRGGIK
jgi:hypothetical protein